MPHSLSDFLWNEVRLHFPTLPMKRTWWDFKIDDQVEGAWSCSRRAGLQDGEGEEMPRYSRYDRQWSTMINRLIDDNCIGLCLSWNIKWKFFPFSISSGWGWRRWWPGSSLHWTRVWRLACPEGNAWSFLFIVISILDAHYCSYTYNQRLSSRKLWCICSK